MDFLLKNVPLVSIILFIAMFVPFYLVKPGFLYNRDGSIKQFGIGHSNRTILPIWLLSIILGILSYLFIVYYATQHIYW